MQIDNANWRTVTGSNIFISVDIEVYFLFAEKINNLKSRVKMKMSVSRLEICGTSKEKR